MNTEPVLYNLLDVHLLFWFVSLYVHSTTSLHFAFSTSWLSLAAHTNRKILHRAQNTQCVWFTSELIQCWITFRLESYRARLCLGLDRGDLTRTVSNVLVYTWGQFLCSHLHKELHWGGEHTRVQFKWIKHHTCESNPSLSTRFTALCFSIRIRILLQCV